MTRRGATGVLRRPRSSNSTGASCTCAALTKTTSQELSHATEITFDEDCGSAQPPRLTRSADHIRLTLEAIKWKATQGLAHTGVVTLHQLGPRLTRVMLDLDVEPGSARERPAAACATSSVLFGGDLHCLKAFIDMQEVESGAWRGRIEDGAIVKEHDPEYDGSREYSDPKATLGEPDEDEATDDRDRDPQDEESRAGRRRAGKGSQAPGRSASGPSSGGGQQSSSRSASSGSRRASGRSGQHPRSASRASRRSSGTKTRGRQATARKNS